MDGLKVLMVFSHCFEEMDWFLGCLALLHFLLKCGWLPGPGMFTTARESLNALSKKKQRQPISVLQRKARCDNQVRLTSFN